MGKVTTNWLTPGHSGSPCHHDDIYTKMNKKTGAVYSVKLCNPSDSCNELQATGRNAFGVISAALSAWINANKDPETTDYKKVKAQYERQTKYSSIRGLMMALGMYTVGEDGEVVVDVNARTNFKLVRDKITGAADYESSDSEGGTTKYTLNLAASPTNGGTVTGAGSYEAGTSVEISATPAADYTFSRWSDGDTNATRSVTVNASQTLTAVFTKTSSGGSGTDTDGQLS